MKKKIQKHIDKQNFVKVYLTDKNDCSIKHFEGVILEQSKSFILMMDCKEFNYDGLVVARKRDIAEIKWTDNERFFHHVLKKENMLQDFISKTDNLNLNLSSIPAVFESVMGTNTSIIIECLYGSTDLFILGTIEELKKKRVRINYINARGEYDIKPVSVKFEDITYIGLNSRYSNMFVKYGKH